MKLNPTIEAFYKSILKYSGLAVLDDGSIVLMESTSKPNIKNSEDKHYHLPYSELTSNPEGKCFFHLLRESFENPETETFKIYKHHLLESINARIGILMGLLIELGANEAVQATIKSGDLIRLLKAVGEVEDDLKNVVFKTLIKAQKEQGASTFIDFFLKKNGQVDGKDYAYIGKTNFLIEKEIKKALDKSEYKLFGTSMRKKDVIGISNVFKAIFPDTTGDEYNAGTDNTIFGYLNVLLNVSYTVSKRISDVVEILTTDVSVEEDQEASLIPDYEWVNMLEKLYGMQKEINFIPSQDNLMTEARTSSNKIKVNESQAMVRDQSTETQIPTFTPSTPEPKNTTVYGQTHVSSEGPTLTDLLNSGNLDPNRPVGNFGNSGFGNNNFGNNYNQNNFATNQMNQMQNEYQNEVNKLSNIVQQLLNERQQMQNNNFSNNYNNGFGNNDPFTRGNNGNNFNNGFNNGFDNRFNGGSNNNMNNFGNNNNGFDPFRRS